MAAEAKSSSFHVSRIKVYWHSLNDMLIMKLNFVETEMKPCTQTMRCEMMMVKICCVSSGMRWTSRPASTAAALMLNCCPKLLIWTWWDALHVHCAAEHWRKPGAPFNISIVSNWRPWVLSLEKNPSTEPFNPCKLYVCQVIPVDELWRCLADGVYILLAFLKSAAAL